MGSVDPCVGTIPAQEEETQPTPVFLPGELHGQRSLMGYSPWGGKELDMTEHLHARMCTHIHMHAHTHLHLQLI